MKTSLVLTLLGKDEPGLVGKISARVTRHGGNWEHSFLAGLDGYFGGMLQVMVEGDQAAALQKDLEALADDDLSITLRQGTGVDESATPVTVSLEVVGHDRAGIVSEITEAIAARGINVAELETSIENASMSTEMHFRALAELHAPSHESAEALQDDLERIADDLMVDLDFA